MARQQPEVITGARGPRGPETVTQNSSPEDHPVVGERELKPEEAHFVSRFKEYDVTYHTEADTVTSGGKILPGRNKRARFSDFHLVTSDPELIAHIRGMGRGVYGLGCEVWEKYQQDADIAQKAIGRVEEVIDSLPPETQEAMLSRLRARFESFRLPGREQQGQQGQEEQGQKKQGSE